jgi:ribosomal protein L12E/L44/L45/RPP1/RPP2
MIKTKDLRAANIDTDIGKSTIERKLDQLCEQNLLSKAQSTLIYKALHSDTNLTISETRALVEMSQLFLKNLDEVAAIQRAPNLSEVMPPIVILKRQSVRMYPDGTKVALYYADGINKYVTIPFNEIGSVAMNEEVEKKEPIMTKNIRERFSQRVQMLAEVSDAKKAAYREKAVKSFDDNFEKSYKDMGAAADAYSSKNYITGAELEKIAMKSAKAMQNRDMGIHRVDGTRWKKGEKQIRGMGDGEARKEWKKAMKANMAALNGVVKEEAEELSELSNAKLATYAAFSRTSATDAWKKGDEKTWRKRDAGMRLAVSKAKGETAATRAERHKKLVSGQLAGSAPKFIKEEEFEIGDFVHLGFTSPNGAGVKCNILDLNEDKVRVMLPNGGVRIGSTLNIRPLSEAEQQELHELWGAIASGAAKAAKWAAGKFVSTGAQAAQQVGNNLADPKKDKEDEDKKDKGNMFVSKVRSPTENQDNLVKSRENARDEKPYTAVKAAPPKEDDDTPKEKKKPKGKEKIEELAKIESNDSREFVFEDGVVKINGAVAKDMLAIYEKANSTNKKRIETAIFESAQKFKEFADFAVKTKEINQ